MRAISWAETGVPLLTLLDTDSFHHFNIFLLLVFLYCRHWFKGKVQGPRQGYSISGRNMYYFIQYFGFRSFRSTAFSFEEQRVISLLRWIKEKSIEQISGSERKNFLHLERRNCSETKRPDTNISKGTTFLHQTVTNYGFRKLFRYNLNGKSL